MTLYVQLYCTKKQLTAHGHRLCRLGAMAARALQIDLSQNALMENVERIVKPSSDLNAFVDMLTDVWSLEAKYRSVSKHQQPTLEVRLCVQGSCSNSDAAVCISESNEDPHPQVRVTLSEAGGTSKEKVVAVCTKDLVTFISQLLQSTSSVEFLASDLRLVKQNVDVAMVARPYMKPILDELRGAPSRPDMLQVCTGRSLL